MNTLTQLDDPLGAPPIEPSVVRRRAHQLRRRRSGWRTVGVTGCAVAVALAWLARPDAVRVDTGPDAAATQPPVCAPSHRVTRSLLAISGVNPADNETLAQAFVEILGSGSFVEELHGRLDADLAARVTINDLRGSLSVSRRPSSAIIEIAVQAPSADDADRLSEEVAPTLTQIIESSQRNLPIEDRIPGPIVEEVAEATTAEVPC